MPLRRRSVPTRATCLVVAVAVFCSLALTSCTPATLEITTAPGLFPAFSPAITDYVSRCNKDTLVHLSVNTPADTTVSVAGQPYRAGAFKAAVRRGASQSYTIVSKKADVRTSYYVRCLPSDFPSWVVQRNGTPQPEFYALAPFGIFPDSPRSSDYVAIFDTNGVPIWWKKTDPHAFFTPEANGYLAITRKSGDAQEMRVDGSIVRAIAPVGGMMDNHDVQLMPNGHYLVVTNMPRQADLTEIGGPASVTMPDPVVQEVTSAGAVIWSWSTMDHIPVTETDPHWHKEATDPLYWDVYHWNSIGLDNSGNIILSYRHLNAIVGVNKSTGAIAWKLGGSTRAESLTVLQDPVYTSGGGFMGQHDPRMLPDGSLTVHDNRTDVGPGPRALRYTLDLTARTATLVEQLTDPKTNLSRCCGSARKLSGGNWVMNWGLTTGGLKTGYSNSIVTEMTPSGTRVFGLSFQDSFFTYRAIPVPYGRFHRSVLRAGMDKQFPPCTTPAGCMSAAPPPRSSSSWTGIGRL
ncbi:MAG: hypothetical protein JWM05_3597 [Acidimicrobiales bacterium]|nr:hypothetical protein [Acidimicrobiales bacterium]